MKKNIKIAFIASSPTSCHSIAITTTGIAYGWGRNETGQLGLGYVSAVVPTPTQLSVSTTTGGGGESSGIKFVGAGVGKYHTILIGSDGMAYASGGNLCGQLGINNQGCRGIDKFKKCIVSGQGDGEEEGDVKIVQVGYNDILCMCVFCDFCRTYFHISYYNKIDVDSCLTHVQQNMLKFFEGFVRGKYLGLTLLLWTFVHCRLVRVGTGRQW
jgi:hypothetical protein